MFVLQVGYPVRNYDEWRQLFDRDPAGRSASGARSFRIFRDANEGSYVVVQLDFDTKDAAEAFLDRLRSQVWDNPDLMGPLLGGTPTAIVLEQVASEEIGPD